MKQVLLPIFSILIFSASAQNVTIPDANFKAYLVGNTSINTNGDMEIQQSEASVFTGSLWCGNASISDFTGLESFSSITALECNANALNTLNVSQNIALTELYCDDNNLNTLDLTSLPLLTTLVCEDNPLGPIDLSQNTGLQYLNCSNNGLTTIDLSQNIALTTLFCEFNSFSSLDLSANTLLTSVYCNNNSIATLDFTQNTALTYINCRYNGLSSIDISQNSTLVSLICSYNSLTNLSTSTLPALDLIYCNNNNMSSMDMSQNTALTKFECFNNSNLTYLNMKNLVPSNVLTFNSTGTSNLTCIEVDNISDATAAWTVIDAANNFNLNCCSIDTSITMTNYILSATQSGAMYQWIDCNNSNSPISGETSQSFTATLNGNYACIITENACSDTSACVTVNTIGVDELQMNLPVIYPNPAHDVLFIQTDETILKVSIYNLLGELIKEENTSKLSITDLTTGIYVINIETTDSISQQRFVKN